MNKKGTMSGGIGALIGVVVAILVLGLISGYASKINYDMKVQECEDNGYYWNASEDFCRSSSGDAYIVNDSLAFNVTSQTEAAGATVGTNLSLIMTITVVAVIITLLLGAFSFGKRT